MKIIDITNLPRTPRPGQRLRVDHATLLGLDSGLDPGEHVVVRCRGWHHVATVVHVSFGLDDTVYDLQVGAAVEAEDLAALGAVEPRHRRWESEDVMAVLCRLKRTEVGCEETCSTCALNPASAEGWILHQTMHDQR